MGRWMVQQQGQRVCWMCQGCVSDTDGKKPTRKREGQTSNLHLSKPRIFKSLPLSVLLSRDTRCKDFECFRVQLFFSCQAWWQPLSFRIHYSIGQTSYNLQLSPVVNLFLFFFLCLSSSSSFLNYYYYVLTGAWLRHWQRGPQNRYPAFTSFRERESRFGLAVRRSRRSAARFRFGFPFSSKKLWFVDTVL